MLALTGTVVSLQSGVMLPLLPSMPHLIDTTASGATWLVTATLLAGAIATPIVSRLADMVGKKRMMLVALGAMVAGSALGAAAPSLLWLVAARTLQGVGLSLIPVGIAMMRDLLPREKVPLGVALMSSTMAVGSAAGLPLSGLIVHHLDWHAIFWLTGAGGAVMMAAIALVLEESPTRTSGRFDIPGALVLSAALTAVLLFVSQGGQWGWLSPRALGCAALGLLLVGLFVPMQLRAPRPLVDLRVAARPVVRRLNLVGFLIGFAMYTNVMVGTQLFQLPVSTGFGLGLGIGEAGLAMAPSALMFGVMAPVSAWTSRRFGPVPAIVVGSASLSLVYVARVFTSEDLWQVVLGSMLVAGSTSLVFAALPILMMRSVPLAVTASANGMNTLLRSMGTSLSSATAAAAVSLGIAGSADGLHPTFGSLAALFWLSALAAAGALLVALRLARGDLHHRPGGAFGRGAPAILD